jgi:hypothetical protein
VFINNIEYFTIRNFKDYVINKSGIVYNTKYDRYVVGSTNPAGYHNFRLVNDHGHVHTIGRHRLLGIVFIKTSLDMDYAVINHINGVKGDDWLDNLEWTTPTGNIEHAGDIGLTDKCKPILVRDVDTGIVIEYPSYVKCALALDLSKDNISYRIDYPLFGQIFPERKQYKLKYDKNDWVLWDNIEDNIKRFGRTKNVSLKFLLTGIVKHFNKLTDLAAYLKVSPSTITKYINLEAQPTLPGYIQVKLTTDSNIWREVYDIYYELELYNPKLRHVIVLEDNCEPVVYKNLIDCSKAHDLKITTLAERLSSRTFKKKYNNKVFMYYTEYLINGPVI